jgi:hypothetical protein
MKKLLKILGYFFLVVILGQLFIHFAPKPYISPEVVAAQAEKNRLEKSEELILDYKWHFGGFDNVLMLNGKITNPAKESVWSDPVITCYAKSESGRQIGEVEKSVYKVIPAGGFVILKDFPVGLINSQTSTISCIIAGRKTK